MYRTAALALTLAFSPTLGWADTAQDLIAKIASEWRILQNPQTEEGLEQVELIDGAVNQLFREHPDNEMAIRLQLGQAIGSFSLAALENERQRQLTRGLERVWSDCRKAPTSDCLLGTVSQAVIAWAPQVAGVDGQSRADLLVNLVTMRLYERGDGERLRQLRAALPLSEELSSNVEFAAALLEKDIETSAEAARAMIQAGKIDPATALYFMPLPIVMEMERPSAWERFVLGETAEDRIAAKFAEVEASKRVGPALSLADKAIRAGHQPLADVLVNMVLELPDRALKGRNTRYLLESAGDLMADGFTHNADLLYRRVLQGGTPMSESSSWSAYKAMAHAGLGEIDQAVGLLREADGGQPFAQNHILKLALKQLGYQKAMEIDWPIALDSEDMMLASEILMEEGDVASAQAAFKRGMSIHVGYFGFDVRGAVLLARHAHDNQEYELAAAYLDQAIEPNLGSGYRLLELLQEGHDLMSPAQIDTLLDNMTKKTGSLYEGLMSALTVVGQVDVPSKKSLSRLSSVRGIKRGS